MMPRRYDVGVPGRELPAPLPLGARARLRVRHGWRLGREVVRYGADQRLWWLVPVVAVVGVVALVLSTASSTVPVAVYTLF